ncbi:MAG TPA: glycosyltransferase family 4 protein [Chthoniobacterales bacterium]|nr:glycosyltransferase family 4 protein [Chthoniobacterales bacterium]
MRLAYLFERFPAFSQTFCYREVAELIRQGAKIDIYSLRRPTEEPAQDWDEQIVERVHYLPEEKPLLEEVARMLRKRKLPPVRETIDHWGRKTDFLRLQQAVYVGLPLQDAGIRHVHAHFAGMAARTAYWIENFFGIGFSFTAHANDIFAPRAFEISLEKLVDRARFVVTETDYAANFLRERFAERGERIHRVYNGLVLVEFRRADFSAELPTIVSVGRLIEKKGFPYLLESCRLLKERGHVFRCQIIGEGPLESDLRGRIAEFQLQNHVELLGPKPQRDIVGYLAAAAVFALPSVIDAQGGMDNLPSVIMEAMAAGLPVISTPIGGIPEMVVDGLTGILVTPGDSTALADAVEKLIVDLPLARRLGQSGYERARELFAIEKSAAALIRLFEQLRL